LGLTFEDAKGAKEAPKLKRSVVKRVQTGKGGKKSDKGGSYLKI